MNSNKIKTMPEIKPYKKMTAVEWLIEQIKDDHNQKALSAKEWLEVIEKAKSKEKQQIIDAVEDCRYGNGTDYYNKIYKQ